MTLYRFTAVKRRPGGWKKNPEKKFEKSIDKPKSICYTIIKVEGSEGKPQSIKNEWRMKNGLLLCWF